MRKRKPLMAGERNKCRHESPQGLICSRKQGHQGNHSGVGQGGIEEWKQERPWRPAKMLRTIKTRIGFTYKSGSPVWARWSVWAKSWEIKRWYWVGDPTSRINNVCGGVPRKAFEFIGE